MTAVSRWWARNKVALFFLSPWLAGMIMLSLVPMVVSLYLSFTNYNLFEPPRWIGLTNYTNMFLYDTRYLKALQVTFVYVFVAVPLQLLLALALALFLNRGMFALEWFRGIFYIPSLLGPSVAIALLWRKVFGNDGIFNVVVAPLGIQPRSWIGDPDTALMTLIVLHVWQFGSPMVIFLAGLKQIPKEFYEAAAIDGAGRIGTLFRITLPLLTPIIFFNLIMQIINAFQAFTSAFIIGGSDGGVLDSMLFYTLYLFINGFNNFQMGYASAMAWVLLLIIGFFTALFFATSKRWVYYES